jgi:hypothetical protein
MDYEQGLERLKQLATNTTWYYDVLNYEARLQKNLQHEKLYGMDPSTSADRAQIVDQLNRLAAAHVGKSFNDLCKRPAGAQVSAVPRPGYRNPIRRNLLKVIFVGATVVVIATFVLAWELPKLASGGILSSEALCQYDSTNGFKGWNNSPQWSQLSDGTLVSSGTDNGEGSKNYMAWSGCHTLPTPNYAVEAQIEYIRSADPNSDNYDKGMFEFGIMLHGDGNTSGYEVGVGQDACGNASIALISLIQQAQIGSTSQCSSGPVPLPSSGSGQTSLNHNVDTNNFHTYRAEINNNMITLYIDNSKLLQTSDNTFTSAGQVGLRDIYGQITVKSFKVTTLS